MWDLPSVGSGGALRERLYEVGEEVAVRRDHVLRKKDDEIAFCPARRFVARASVIKAAAGDNGNAAPRFAGDAGAVVFG